jgi:hypothetical protein
VGHELRGSPAALSPDGCLINGTERNEAAILLIDSDVGFIFWLGKALDLAGYESLPAINIRAATELIEEHRLITDILVIDPFVQGALPFLFHLRQSHPSLKAVAALPVESEKLPDLSGFEAIRRKPTRLTGDAASEWVDLIDSLFQFPRNVYRS